MVPSEVPSAKSLDVRCGRAEEAQNVFPYGDLMLTEISVVVMLQFARVLSVWMACIASGDLSLVRWIRAA